MEVVILNWNQVVTLNWNWVVNITGICTSDYRSMKLDYSEKITKLEHELSEVSNDRQSIDGLLNCGIENLIKLNGAYNNASLVEARDLIGLIYPENFTIRGTQVQTTRINKVIESIYMINNELCSKKTGQKRIFSLCPVK